MTAPTPPRCAVCYGKGFAGGNPYPCAACSGSGVAPTAPAPPLGFCDTQEMRGYGTSQTPHQQQAECANWRPVAPPVASPEEARPTTPQEECSHLSVVWNGQQGYGDYGHWECQRCLLSFRPDTKESTEARLFSLFEENANFRSRLAESQQREAALEEAWGFTRASLDAARKDSERLDTLEELCDKVRFQRNHADPASPIVTLDWSARGSDLTTEGATWREAIDKALAARSEAPHE